MSSSRIAVLASTIEQNTRVLDEYLRKNGLPSPSFDASNPPDLVLPEDIMKAKGAALEAMDELEGLLLGPMPKIFHELTQKHTNLTSLHAVAKFNMASKFSAQETTTIPELASACGIDKKDCERLIRHALTNRIFTESSKGVIAHSAMTQAIANVPLLREWIEETCENMWSSAPRIVSAMAKWPGSEEPNETAFNIAHNSQLPFFAEISKDPANAKRFADSMSFFQASPGMQTALVIDNYNWAAYETGTIVDVGGSQGAVAIELAKRFPNIKCVVQDLPEVIAGAPKDVNPKQVKFQEYDFFTEQLVKDADVYFFRMIFHNWGDKYCVKILRNLIPALKKGARIVINDHVVPEPGVLSPYQDRQVRAFDLVMKECFNAKERDVNDWTNLLKEADERFAVLEIVRPVGSQLQMINVEWKG
ncbi:S-adenosyl-L-methionine-dependent methyltransferase [Glonium stellatum]|uniref:S-adenosyl-L-methionine-dependent methyltransferase n=1 Tax=Glonium stellatum TaxID=574774 RepID=A0A8E2F0Z2_9PEZI|nr:S-adenosyl-L-methionine-dependent methyltransferase [Glonium stellatum]